jgi:hypothetical protein
LWRRPGREWVGLATKPGADAITHEIWFYCSIFASFRPRFALFLPYF